MKEKVFSEKRMMLLFELANLIAGVYSSGSYNGFTGEEGADVDYPIWFDFGVKNISGIKGLDELKFKKPTYDQIKNAHEKVESPLAIEHIIMNARCKFGSNYMYVIQTAEFILRKLEREHKLKIA